MSSTAVLPIVSQNFLTLSPGYTTVTPSSANSSVSRAGNATLFDSTGKLTYAPNNLLAYSNTFSNVVWQKLSGGTGTAPVVTDNYATAPDNSNTAARLQFSLGATPTSATSRLYTPVSGVPGVNYINSIWLKSNTGLSQVLYLSSGTGNVFSLITVTTSWQRFYLAPSNTGNPQIQFGLSGASGAVGIATDTSADVLAWGAQLEAVTYQTTPSTYVATTASAYYGPRYDYNPSTLASKGLLVEAAATNLCTYSQDIANAAWVTKTNVVITADQIAAPDGTTTADQLADDATNGTHRIGCASLAFASGTTYTLSVYAKAGTDTLVQLTFSTGTHSSGPYANFNLSNGTVTQSAGTGIVSGVQSVGNGWYRCFISAPADLPATTNFLIHRINSATATRGPTYAGTGTTIYLWGAQLEAGSFATSYIPTTSASVTRAAETYTRTAYTSQLVMATYTDEQTGSTYYVNLNPGNTWAGNGWITSLRAYDGTTAAVPTWLDVSATTGNRMLYDSTGKLTWAPNNLLTYSEQFNNAVWTKNLGGVGSVPVVTPDAGTAPDGTTTADRIVFTLNGGTAAADVSDVRHAPTTIASKYIFSFWIRSFDGVSSYNMLLRDANGFVNSIAVSGTWTRVSTVATYAAGTSTIGFGIRGGQTPTNPNAADVLVWGAQLEAVTYQTSPSTYIPTTSATYYGPRFDYDPSTLAAKGLLIEESRINLCTNSDNLGTSYTTGGLLAFGSGSTLNAATSPDGTVNADLITEDTTTGLHRIFKTITSVANTVYSFSFYVKSASRTRNIYIVVGAGADSFWAKFNLSTGVVISSGAVGTGSLSSATIESVGNGYYRIKVSGVPSTTGTAIIPQINLSNTSNTTADVTYTGDGTSGVYLFGLQYEAGSFATSYIPTTTASVTRAADIIKLSGAALTAVQGSAVSVLVQTTPWAASSVLTSYGTLGAGSSARLIYGSASGNTLVQTFNGSLATSATIGGGATVNGSITRVGVSWLTAGGANSVSLVANNGTVGNSAATFTIGASIYLGAYSAGTCFGGCVQSIAIYNQRLPNATLQTKSTVGSPL